MLRLLLLLSSLAVVCSRVSAALDPLPSTANQFTCNAGTAFACTCGVRGACVAVLAGAWPGRGGTVISLTNVTWPVVVNNTAAIQQLVSDRLTAHCHQTDRQGATCGPNSTFSAQQVLLYDVTRDMELDQIHVAFVVVFQALTSTGDVTEASDHGVVETGVLLAALTGGITGMVVAGGVVVSVGLWSPALTPATPSVGAIAAASVFAVVMATVCIISAVKATRDRRLIIARIKAKQEKKLLERVNNQSKDLAGNHSNGSADVTDATRRQYVDKLLAHVKQRSLEELTAVAGPPVTAGAKDTDTVQVRIECEVHDDDDTAAAGDSGGGAENPRYLCVYGSHEEGGQTMGSSTQTAGLPTGGSDGQTGQRLDSSSEGQQAHRATAEAHTVGSGEGAELGGGTRAGFGDGVPPTQDTGAVAGQVGVENPAFVQSPH